MVTDAYMYVCVLVGWVGLVFYLEKKSEGKNKLFEWVPPIIWIYAGTAFLGTFGLWQMTPEIKVARNFMRNSFMPVMLVLLLLQCDLRQIIKLGRKMLIAFFAAMFSILLGFIVTYVLFKGMYVPDTWKAFAALSGSWIGGTANMVAVSRALDVPDNAMSYAILMDSINYSIWFMFLLWLVPFKKAFNKWTKADTSVVDAIRVDLEERNRSISKPIDFVSVTSLLAIAFMIAGFSFKIGGLLPELGPVVSHSTWSIIVASTAAIVIAMTTPVSKIPGSQIVGNVFLYLMVAAIASSANFRELASSPLYVASGFVILGIHGIALVLVAKMFKLDLFTCGVASLANIGAAASAPVLAAAHSPALIPIGVLMALLGYICGTYFSLLLGQILFMLT